MTHSLCVCYNSFIVCVPWLIQVSFMTYMCAMTHSYGKRDVNTVELCRIVCVLVCVLWLIHCVCAMTHSCVFDDLFICVPWLIRMERGMWTRERPCRFLCVTWLLHVCAMTYSYVCHDSFICVPYVCALHFCVHDSMIRFELLILTCDMTHSFICVLWLIHSYVCLMCVHYISVCVTQWYVSNHSFICMTWLIHSYVCHDSFICVPYVCALHFCVHDSMIRFESLIHMCDMTHLNNLSGHIKYEWLIHVCAITQKSYLCHDSSTRVCHDSFTRVLQLIHICSITHSYGEMNINTAMAR